MKTPVVSASHYLAKGVAVICLFGLFPSFIIWAICDGHGILPYAMAALALTGLYAKRANEKAIQSQSTKSALLAWLPFVLNVALVFLVSGEISSCH